MEHTKEEIASFLSKCIDFAMREDVEKTYTGSYRKPYYCFISSEIYNNIKILAQDIFDDRGMFYYVDEWGQGGWMQVIVVPEFKEPMSSTYGKIGRVNKPSRQEFMDAKYKHKNFAKDYLMKGKKY